MKNIADFREEINTEIENRLENIKTHFGVEFPLKYLIESERFYNRTLNKERKKMENSMDEVECAKVAAYLDKKYAKEFEKFEAIYNLPDEWQLEVYVDYDYQDFGFLELQEALDTLSEIEGYGVVVIYEGEDDLRSHVKDKLSSDYSDACLVLNINWDKTLDTCCNSIDYPSIEILEEEYFYRS